MQSKDMTNTQALAQQNWHTCKELQKSVAQIRRELNIMRQSIKQLEKACELLRGD